MCDFEKLLQQTSRTFALAIPLLPTPLERQVSLSYLLFRIADTLEDAEQIGFLERGRLLNDFCQACADIDSVDWNSLASTWLEHAPYQNAHYESLLRYSPAIIAELRTFPIEIQKTIFSHAIRSAQGMKKYLELAHSRERFQLRSCEELRDYCFYVAGIVGEMLTSLFLQGSTCRPEHRLALSKNSRWFGEGLQLVNILKDQAVDHQGGRRYLPPQMEQSEIFTMVRQDFDLAEQYTQLLTQANLPHGVIAFTRFVTQLARMSLEAVQTRGPGAKITRTEVRSILSQL